jgi:hypothetical protein
MASPGAAQGYEVSATYVSGLVKALTALRRLEAVTARLGAEARVPIDAPNQQSWWPGALTEQLIDAIEAEGGVPLLEEVGRLNVKNSMGPVVMPLVKVTFAIFGSSPARLFEKMGQFSGTAVRGIAILWTASGDAAGTFEIRYPTPQHVAQSHLWRGGFLGCFDVAGRPGRVELSPVQVAEHGKVLRFSLSWA